jgi:hypothetical protein
MRLRRSPAGASLIERRQGITTEDPATLQAAADGADALGPVLPGQAGVTRAHEPRCRHRHPRSDGGRGPGRASGPAAAGRVLRGRTSPPPQHRRGVRPRPPAPAGADHGDAAQPGGGRLRARARPDPGRHRLLPDQLCARLPRGVVRDDRQRQAGRKGVRPAHQDRHGPGRPEAADGGRGPAGRRVTPAGRRHHPAHGGDSTTAGPRLPGSLQHPRGAAPAEGRRHRDLR